MYSKSVDVESKYAKLNEIIEQISEVIFFGVTKLCVSIGILPALFISAANYFIYNLEDESFFLPGPLM